MYFVGIESKEGTEGRFGEKERLKEREPERVKPVVQQCNPGGQQRTILSLLQLKWT